MADNIEITAKLKLDTSEAEAKIAGLDTKKAGGVAKVALPKDTKIELPKEATEGLKEVFSGPNGLRNIGKVAKSATGGFNSLGGSLAEVAGKAPKVAGIITLIIALISAIIKLMTGTDTWKAVVEMWTKLMNSIKKILAPNLALIGEALMQVIGIVEKFLPLLKIAADLFDLSIEPLIGFVNALKPVFELIGRILTPIQRLVQVLADIGLDVIYYLTSMLADVIEFLITLLEPLIRLFEAIVQAITNLFEGLRDALGFTGRKTQASTKGQQAGNYKTSLDTWETTGDRVTKGEEEIIGAIDDLNNNSGQQADKTNSLLGEFGGIVSAIKSFLEPAISIIKTVIEFIKPIIGNLVENFKKFLGPILTVIQSVLKFIEPIIGFIGSVISWINDNILSPLLNLITKLISFVTDFFMNIVNAIGDALGNIFRGLSASSSSGFGGGLFTSEGRWGDGYNFGDVTGSVVDFVAGLFGKGWLWADGGTLDVGAQIWGMNEQGNPEFLFNAGGHDTVINSEILENAMYRAVKRAGGMGGRIEVSVKESAPSGPRELAQWLLPSLKFALKK